MVLLVSSWLMLFRVLAACVVEGVSSNQELVLAFVLFVSSWLMLFRVFVAVFSWLLFLEQ